MGFDPRETDEEKNKVYKSNGIKYKKSFGI